MEIAISKTPFQQQIHEWKHTHPSPTAENNPIQNHWIKGSFNTYGKMITNNFMASDGTKHTQKKQMEILQARTTSGSALQVVRAQTSQTVSSRTVTSNNGSSNSNNNTSSSAISKQQSSRAERPSSLSLNSISYPQSNFLLKSQTNNNQSPKNHEWDETSEGLLHNKSISNEDLRQQDETQDSDGLEFGQWNRVSRIRRSLQYPSPSSSSTSKTSLSRPLDFPKQSVDVNKIRLELESISVANKIDKSPIPGQSGGVGGELVALDTILSKKAEDEKSIDASITNSDTDKTVTAEILQNVRNRLRRLENDSLYKDEIFNNSTAVGTSSATTTTATTSIEEKPMVNYSNASSFDKTSFEDWRAKLLSNNLKNAQQRKDLNSITRRKSYGFEKLENPHKFETKMESSTDSGLGQSSDFSAIVSPSDDHKRQFFESTRSKISPTRITLFSNDSHFISLPKNNTPSYKRHSTSTSSKLDYDGRTSIHINGNTEDDSSSLDGILDETGKKAKRVEFCKTEIHFAPDSGKVNIVETDGKPPPTNNFRRRKRGSSSSSTSSSSSSQPPVSSTNISTLDSYSHTFGEREEIKILPEVKPIHVVEPHKSTVDLTSLNNLIETTDDMSIKGILKNKLTKPKQYHLGDNLKDIDNIWGVKLNPIYDDLSFSRLHSRNSAHETADHYKYSLSDSDEIPTTTTAIDRTRTRRSDFGYSTKVDFSFENKLLKKPELSYLQNENPTIRKHILPHSQNSSFVKYVRPPHRTLSSCKTTENTPQKVLIPPSHEEELKSISLIKNTIRLGDSPTKFEMQAEIQTKLLEPNLSEIESQKVPKFDIGTLSSVNRNVTNLYTNGFSDRQMHDLKLKQDLDAAFKDLMSVSATLKELGNKSTPQIISKSQNIETFPTIKAQNPHAISTIIARDWNSNTLIKHTNQDMEFSADSDTSENPKKPIPKPRHHFGTSLNQNKPQIITNGDSIAQNYAFIDDITANNNDICPRTKNVVKARQQLFESLSQTSFRSSQENQMPGE